VSRHLQAVRDAHWFQNFITGTILAASVLVGAETFPDLAHAHHVLFKLLDSVILGIFAVEIIVKVGAEGGRPWRYFLDSWNVFDFTIVAVCFLPFGGQGAAVLRLARLLRVLKLVRALPQLRVLVGALLKSIPSMAYVGLLLLLLFYVYAVAGTLFFGENDPVHFGNLQTSFLSLFLIITLEGWTELLYIQMRGCADYGYEGMAAACTASHAQPIVAVTYFVTFVLIGTMIILNLFVGVIMNSMQEAKGEIEEEARTMGRKTACLESELQELQSTLAELQDRLGRVRAMARSGSPPAGARPAPGPE
jgi:voltage-gated sodium channel